MGLGCGLGPADAVKFFGTCKDSHKIVMDNQPPDPNPDLDPDSDLELDQPVCVCLSRK